MFIFTSNLALSYLKYFKTDNMKRSFVILIAALLSMATMAAQNGFGLEIGYATSKNATNSANGKVQSPMLNGLKVGVNYGFNITKGFLFQPGVYYSYLTDKRNDKPQSNTLYLVDVMNEHFLNIPLHFMYNFRISDEVSGLYIFAGPTLIFGMASTSDISVFSGQKELADASYNYYTQELTFGNTTIDAKKLINTYLPKGAWRQFDVSMGIGIGIEVLDHINLKIGYDWGLMNRLNEEAANDFTTRRNQFYITAGMQF